MIVNDCDWINYGEDTRFAGVMLEKKSHDQRSFLNILVCFLSYFIGASGALSITQTTCPPTKSALKLPRLEFTW